MTSALTIVAAVCAVLGAAGSAYFAISIWAAKRFQNRRGAAVDPGFAPPVSIMKSLKGLDPHMYEAFRSHCLQDYGEYELLFGVNSPDEPALELVACLQQEFPQRAVRVIPCPDSLGLNGKVSTLAQMLPHARYEHILINDSDIVAPPDYLRRVMAGFAGERVGMVTSLYRGLAGSTLPS